MARRNISLPDDLDERARRAGLNVSALARRAIAEELARMDQMARWDASLEKLDAEYGPPSDDELAEARAWLASAQPVRRRTPPGERAVG